MYLFVPCDKKSHGTEISFPICSNRLSHPHPHLSAIRICSRVCGRWQLYKMNIH